MRLSTLLIVVYCAAVGGSAYLQARPSQAPNATSPPGADARGVITQYCVTCHNQRLRTAGLVLEASDPVSVASHSDTWEKVNAEGEAKLLRFVSGTVERVSRLKERPRFAKSREQAPAAGPGFRVYLGTIPDYAEEGEGVTLQGVRPGSPAEKAGILAGDVLVEFDGKKIRNVQEYTVVLAGAKPNVAVPVVVLRKKERVMLTITPAERKG